LDEIEIGQMTVVENARLEEAMAQLTTSMQSELERVATLEKKNTSLRQQCEELNKQNLDLVRDSMKGARKLLATSEANDAGAIANAEDCNEWLQRELGDDYTGDIINDVCALKRHVNGERRRKNGNHIVIICFF
jgi:predicted RNase H-like nuclease (RuvC/YqgF family)